MIAQSDNPKPDTLPSLGVWKSEDGTMTYVSSVFPNVPNFRSDSWLYECGDTVVFASAKPISGGRLELRHTWKDHPQQIVTIVTPEPGAVEFYAYLDGEGADKVPLNQYPGLNLCWQLKNSPDFASSPQPYPEFVKRCFIFTDKGMTMLNDTVRKMIPCRKPDEDVNNPVWVQMYVGVWQQVPTSTPTSWADYSDTRYVNNIIGTVSRNGKYLTALGCDSSWTMCQAWHDCMHNNPPWLPIPGDSGAYWRLKIYTMENDPTALVERVRREFPSLLMHARHPVPAKP
jgi:hypothetical protein